jgi:LacI family transcriptional regulator, galactose operon repressor
MTTKPVNVTIKVVADQAGVSPMTVSRVINGSERVSPGTQRRVQQAITDLGYIPSRLARGLSARKTGTMAVIVRAAEEVARRSTYRVILCDTRADLGVERDVVEELIAHRVEGIAIAPVSDRSKPHLARLARFGVPFVLIDRTVAGIDCDAVVGDNAGGARLLVEHLIGLGHRRIGMIVEGDEVSTARERRRGHEGTLKAAGLALEPALVEVQTPDPDGGFLGMSRLLALEEPPSAVFAVNNLVALGAIEAVRDAGLEVPDDVALVCFDDIELASRLYPFLTAMEQPAETFGTLGTQLLLDRIDGRGPAHGHVVVLPGRLTIRRSCGARAVEAV